MQEIIAASAIVSVGRSRSKDSPERRGDGKKVQMRQAILRVLISLIVVIILTVPALSAELRLTIKGINSNRGKILIALYDDGDGFRSAIANAAKRGLIPETGRLIGTAIRAKPGILSTVFTQLAPGRYAMIVIHDENDNGRLDENFFGLPSEGYGFGNNAQGFFGAPSFDAAAVNLETANLSASITLIYPNKP